MSLSNPDPAHEDRSHRSRDCQLYHRSIRCFRPWSTVGVACWPHRPDSNHGRAAARMATYHLARHTISPARSHLDTRAYSVSCHSAGLCHIPPAPVRPALAS